MPLIGIVTLVTFGTLFVGFFVTAFLAWLVPQWENLNENYCGWCACFLCILMWVGLAGSCVLTHQ
jgi:hypothetical protein